MEDSSETNSTMSHVLKRVGMNQLTANFVAENVTPDIVCHLSRLELQQLGVTQREDMVKLRTECITYGSIIPHTRKVNPGPPEFVIPKVILENLIDDGFLICDVAKMLCVSESTIYRRMSHYGISKASMCILSDNELDVHVQCVIKEFPFCGETMLRQLVKHRGVNVQRWRLRDSIRRIDENGIEERKTGRLKIRVYNVKGPNQLWHIDTNHKLIRWNIVIAGGIDGFSRLVVYLRCAENNKAENLLEFFLSGVQAYGTPQRVRSDKGMENVCIADFMISKRGTGRGSMITGKSVHNQRIERLWRYVYVGVLAYYYNLFNYMEDAGILDPFDDMHIACLHYTYISKINEKLQHWKEAWSGHRLRTVGSSPRRLWVAGQLQSPVGISPAELVNYGVEGIVTTDREDRVDGDRPVISAPQYVFADNIQQRLDNEIGHSWVSNQYGIDVYRRVLNIINSN